MSQGWWSTSCSKKNSKKKSSGVRLQCEQLEQRQLLDASFLLDFDTANSPVASGYTSVMPAAYTAALGFGWGSVNGIAARDYQTPSDVLLRDVHLGKNRAFVVDLPNGTYDVTPTLGNPKFFADEVSVFLEGTRVATRVTTRPGEFIQPTFRVTVTDGRLTLGIGDAGGRNPWFSLAGLSIQPVGELPPPSPPPAPPPPGAPTANAGADQVASEGSSVQFNGSGSGGTGALSYLWDFGDGTTTFGTSTPTHVYADNGQYTIKLTVTDAAGLSASDTALVTVSNVAPTALFGNNGPANEGSAVNFSFSGQADPASADRAVGFKYSYDFNNDGLFDVVDSTSATRSHTFADNGVYTVRGRIKDKDGGFTDYATSVTVNNVAPVADHGGPYTGIKGVAVSFSGSAADAGSADVGSLSFAWAFGDGGSAVGAKATHIYSQAGTYSVTLTVADKDGGVHAVTTTATISEPPVPPPSDPALEYSSYTGLVASPRETVFLNGGARDGWRLEAGSLFAGSLPSFPVIKTYGPTGGGSDGYIALYDRNNTPVALVVLGGTGVDRGYGIAVDSTQSHVYLFGQTSSADLPTTAGAADRTRGTGGGGLGAHGSALDAYVAKFDLADFCLIYSTYVGGDTGTDGARGGGAVGPDGSAYVFGFAESADMPGAVNAHTGGTNAFVTKIAPDGSRIEWTRYFGTASGVLSGQVMVGGVVDAQGRIYVHGILRAAGAVTTADAFQPGFGGGEADVYVAVLNPDSTIRFASYYGGAGAEFSEHSAGLITDANGHGLRFAFSGSTTSTNLPLRNATQGSLAGGSDGFLALIDVQNPQLLLSTYIGGSGTDSAFGAGVDGNGDIFVSGLTTSSSLVTTTDAFDRSYNGGQDTFLARFNANGGQYTLAYLTYYGGNGDEYARYAATNADGTRVAIVGELRNTTDLPTTNGSALAAGGVDSFSAVFAFP